MPNLDYTIKLVYPDWVIDDLRDKRMGFGSKYRNIRFPIGAKMLIYLTEQQLIMGINTVKGTFKDGEIYPKRTSFPLRLPVVLDYEVQKDKKGLHIKEIQTVVPEFKPHKDMSFFPLNEDQYKILEKMLYNVSS